MVEIIAGWKPDGSSAAAHWQWAQDLWAVLAPFALPVGYANFLTPQSREQIKDAYGGNGTRLAALKLVSIRTVSSPLPSRCPISIDGPGAPAR